MYAWSAIIGFQLRASIQCMSVANSQHWGGGGYNNDFVLKISVASDSLLLREIFGVKLTRTGSIEASRRQSRPRKEESPFSRFSMKTSRRLTNVSLHVRVLYVLASCTATRGNRVGMNGTVWWWIIDLYKGQVGRSFCFIP